MSKRVRADLPPEIRDDDTNGLDPEEALAQLAIALVTNKSIKMMSYLKNEEDSGKVWLMYSMSRRKAFDFLKPIADDKLELLCSTDKGVRARLAVEMAKALSGGAGGEEKLGLTDRIKGVFKRGGGRDFVESGH